MSWVLAIPDRMSAHVTMEATCLLENRRVQGLVATVSELVNQYTLLPQMSNNYWNELFSNVS